MADSVEYEAELTRTEFADYLRELADEFDGNDSMSVPVGNKRVTLDPPERVTSEVEVIERSSILRGDHEAIELDVRWEASR